MSTHPAHSLILVALLALSPVALTACDNKGPAEKAGEKIDDAAEKAAEKMEEAGRAARAKIKEGTDKVEEGLDKAKEEPKPH